VTAIGITGDYRARCAVVALPRSEAAALLASNCELGEQPLTPPGTHPIVFLFGEQWNVRLLHTPFIAKYLETVLSVPWVRPRDKKCGVAPLANVSRLWLNKLGPVMGGWFWGFPKMWESIAIGGGTYAVRNLISKRPIVSAQYELHGEKAPPSRFPHFQVVRPIFEQTFIQRFLVYGPTRLCKLDFEIDRATLQPLTGTIVCSRPALNLKIESIETTPLGGFMLELPWTLTYPFRCGGQP
jgi:hypothetical protein